MGNLCGAPKERASDDSKYKVPGGQRLPPTEDTQDMNTSYSFIGDQPALYSSIIHTPPPKPKRQLREKEPTPMIRYITKMKKEME